MGGEFSSGPKAACVEPRLHIPISARPVRCYREKAHTEAAPGDIGIEPKEVTQAEQKLWAFVFRNRTADGWIKQTIMELRLRDPTVDYTASDAAEEFPYVMFEDQYGNRAEADKIQTLAVGRDVSGAVVDAWVNVLNNDPAYRDPSLPRRLFCVHSTVVEWVLTLATDPSGSRVSAFESGLRSSVCGREHLLDLKEIDMLFVPLLERNHFYLIVFDLVRDDINLVDHMVDGESDVALRDHEECVFKTTTFKVKHIFIEFLELVKHPKVAVMRSAIIRRESLAWSTTRRGASPNVDSAIFTMRHMERFLGSRRDFFCGFSSHGSRKKAQCNYLRKKYASQIVLSPVNKYHGDWRGRIART